MRKSIFKWVVGTMLCVLVTVMSCMVAFASWDGDCNWTFNGTNAIARWDKCEDAKGYILSVFKKTSGNPTLVYGPDDFGGKSRDVSSAIINKGTGTYYFVVTAYGKNDSGFYEIDTLESEDLDIESGHITNMKNHRKEVKQEQASTDGWHSYPNNTWTYGKGNNTLAKNEWLQINGKWYHFDNKGYMNKGWNQIDGKYYYFDTKNGDLWTNTTTPDGYTVNADGVRIDNGGTPVTGTPVGAKVTVTLKETGDAGRVKNAEVTAVNNATLVGWQFETPYDQWSVGTPVKLFVNVNPSNGFPFDSKSTFSCNNAIYNTFHGANPTTVEFIYYPKMKLAAPTNLTVDSSNIVKWAPVNSAQSYTVRLYSEGSAKESFTVETNSADIGQYVDDYEELSVGVTAVHSKKGKTSSLAKYYQNSDETRLENVKSIIEGEQTAEGTFYTSDGNLYYRDGNGNKVKGWQNIQGSWYRFDNLGKAAGPGWWQDTDGNWYYFDKEHKMMTGKINDGKGDYFLNDGSNSAFPVGAWVH